MPDDALTIEATELGLAQVLTRMFDPALDDLNNIVLRSKGNGLYEVYASREWPTQRQITHLLDGLQARNEKAAFFRGVMLARPNAKGLQALIASGCPEALDALPEVAAQVEVVVRGIDAARAELADDIIAAPLRAARDDLEQVARGIGYLAAYKLLHDWFQKLHLQLPQLLQESARLAIAPEAWIQVEASRASIEAMRVEAVQLLPLLTELQPGSPPNTPGDRATETRLATRIAQLAETFDRAISTNDVETAQRASEDTARLIRIETRRLELMMFRVAGKFPLIGLVGALEAVLSELERRTSSRSAALAAAVSQLELLRIGLLWQIEVHHLWQDAENELWAAEDVLRNERDPDEARDHFAVLWVGYATSIN